MSVRVRFAPSPTGMLHVGALRDALFKYLFAKRHGGQNILRIEDTDRSRYSPESEAEFLKSLDWVGISYDEGPHVGGPHAPYRQSERKEAGIYAAKIEELVALGHAYKAFETPQELEEMREFQQINKRPVGYFGGAWRDAPASRVAEAEASGQPFVIRQRIPRNQTIVIDDVIRGRIEWDSNTVDDPVLIKADGMPTYHFAAMVDDHLMRISHVIRGEEWISSAPKHACLFDAFGWQRPIFVHCPVIVGSDGKKLSKRHGATRVLDYAGAGYLPQPLKNFVVLIGWSPGDEREIMTEQEMESSFALEGLQPSPGRFDMDKLRWMNGAHIRGMDAEALLDILLAYARSEDTRAYWSGAEREPGRPLPDDVMAGLSLLEQEERRDRTFVLEAVKLEQERVQTLADFGLACRFFFEEEPEIDEKAREKWLREPHVPELLAFLTERLSAQRVPVPGGSETTGASVSWCEAMIREFADRKGLEKLGPVVHPTRVALTGKTVGPGLFELMSVLGPDRMLRRIRRAQELL